MAHSLSHHFNNLKQVLLSLNPTGEKGFEGLIAVMLREITGVPFRLAGSGRQFGIDGKNAYDNDAICFECKRYEDDIPRNEVITKIADLARNDTQPDLAWVLGATSRLKTQLANEARADGRKAGISVLILDWSDSDLPPLAVALAMGNMSVEDFLRDNINEEKALHNALSAIHSISVDKAFQEHAKRIKQELDVPAMAFALAKEANAKWLSEAFSNRKCARDRLGQPLSPGESLSKVFHRKLLADALEAHLSAPPDEKVVFVLGNEGCGKSWIVAKTWLEVEPKPLMLILKPEEIKETFSQNDINSFLIRKLIEQSGDEETEINSERWRRRISQWGQNQDAKHSRIVVVIDGINQRPGVDWGRMIDRVNGGLGGIGGRLIVTARAPYFNDSVKRRLTSDWTEILIPEWASEERDKILDEHGISPNEIHPDVKESLRNPRLLGIALELLNKNDIAVLKELSVSRLLFEHIRANEQNGPSLQLAHEFAKQLQTHAQSILSRVQAKQEDDLNIFESETPAVADGRFFHPVDGEPGKYELKNEGLTLALGFSLVDRLRKAKRNGHDLDGALVKLLEPIAALDDTANVVLAALTVTTIDDDQYIPDIASALVKGFSGLQNPDNSRFHAFAGLAKSRPQAFMDAARGLCLAEMHPSNFDWIQEALIEASKDIPIWGEMADEIKSWLSVYSLSPDVRMRAYSSRDSVEKVQEERKKSQQALDEKLKALSIAERSILERLEPQNGDLNSLNRLAMYLLAGKKLVNFADYLVNWSFANALNSDYAAPRNHLIALVSLNKSDWRATRVALLKACELLRESNISRVGKWALVTILYAIGSSDDAKEACSVVTELRKGEPHFKGWRLIEDYCATDPCDPTSIEPENISETTKRFMAADVGKLNLIMGLTSEDHFFKMAMTGMARFAPEVAVIKQREFTENIIERSGLPLRQGLLNLREHNALLTRSHADNLIKKWREAKSSGLVGGLTDQDAWIVRQYHLLLAFPLLNALEQTEILLLAEEDENILLDLMNMMGPVDEVSFDRLLNNIRKNYDEYKLYLLLAMAKSTRTPLSQETREYIATLVSSDSARIRAWTLGIIAGSDYDDMLTVIVKSGWGASNIESDNGFEEWYGSAVILKAAKKNLIDHQEALERISPRLYGQAAVVLNTNAIYTIAQRINESIEQVIGLDENLVAPDINLHVHQNISYEPDHFSVKEKESSLDFRESVKRFSESSQEFEEREQRINATFIEFKAGLTKAKARIILDSLRFEEVAAIIAAHQEIGNKWYTLFMKLPNSKLSVLHNLILLLAHVLSEQEPEKAKDLFQRVRNSNPVVRFVFGKVGVDLDAMAIWAGGNNPVLKPLRVNRLDRAGTDYDLSMEVFAGLMNGQQEFLEQYIEQKLSSEEPAQIARGIMVAGFSDESEFNSKVLSRYEGSAGLIELARIAAKYAYERNSWARYWFKQMCMSSQPDDFWYNSVLFNKIVDERFELWKDEYEHWGAPILAFGSSAVSGLKNRYKRWGGKRKAKFFGDKVPDAIFLNCE